MKKTNFLIVCLLILSVSVFALDPYIGDNTNFEDGTTNWSAFGNVSITSSGTSQEGSKSIKITKSNTSPGGITIALDKKLGAGGSNLIVEAFVRIKTGPSNAEFSIGLEHTVLKTISGGVQIPVVYQFPGMGTRTVYKNKWTKVIIRCNTARWKTISADLQLFLDGTDATYYIDNVKISMSGVNAPFPQQVDYNGCIKPNNVNQDSLDKSVGDYFDQWKEDYLHVGTTPYTYYLKMFATGTGGTTIIYKSTSEAVGYGMMIFALMAGYDYDAQKIFDGIYRMSRIFPSPVENNCNLMSYAVPNDEDPGKAEGSAADGDLDIAYALILAHKQWGSVDNGSEYHYLNEAKAIINTNGILEWCISPVTKRIQLGDFVLEHSADATWQTWDATDILYQIFGLAPGSFKSI